MLLVGDLYRIPEEYREFYILSRIPEARYVRITFSHIN